MALWAGVRSHRGSKQARSHRGNTLADVQGVVFDGDPRHSACALDPASGPMTGGVASDAINGLINVAMYGAMDDVLVDVYRDAVGGALDPPFTGGPTLETWLGAPLTPQIKMRAPWPKRARGRRRQPLASLGHAPSSQLHMVGQPQSPDVSADIEDAAKVRSQPHITYHISSTMYHVPLH